MPTTTRPSSDLTPVSADQKLLEQTVRSSNWAEVSIYLPWPRLSDTRRRFYDAVTGRTRRFVYKG